MSRLATIALVAALIAVDPARAAFDDIVTGARPQGLGGAFVAVADDANALYWNPAGLTQLDSAEVTFMHANEYDITVGPQLSSDFVGFVNWPMSFGTMGVSFFQEGNSKILQERSLVLSYARDISPIGSIGMNVKYLELDPSGTQVNPADPALQDQGTFSFDLSGLYTITPYWKLGFLVRNLLGELGTAEREELRKTYRVGSAYRFEDLWFQNDAFVWSLDLYTREDVEDVPGTKVRAASGVEYSIDERFSIRAGVNNGNFAAGLGLGHPESGIFIDYAYSDDDPGTTHRLSATYRFGAPPGEIHVVHHKDKVVHHHARTEEAPVRGEPRRGPVEGKADIPESPVNPRAPQMARASRTSAAQLGAPPVRRVRNIRPVPVEIDPEPEKPRRAPAKREVKKSKRSGSEYDRELGEFLEE